MTVACLCLLCSFPADGTNWPGFRGVGDSQTRATPLPLSWSDKENVAWRAEIPGYGQSSPVVWDDLVVVTSAEGPQKETLWVTGWELTTGKQRWAFRMPASNQVAVSDYVSRSAPTPAIDAERIYAFFESGDLVALDHNGKECWRLDILGMFGPYVGNHGLGTSLLRAPDRLVLLIAHDGPSYLLAIEPASGQVLWRTEEEFKTSWSTPVWINGEIVVSSNGAVYGFDPKDGSRRWRIDGWSGNNVPSPSPSGDGRQLAIGSGDRGSNGVIERTADGRMEVAWKSATVTSAFGSPLLIGGFTYIANKSGALWCLDAETGEELWSHRLPASCWASPLGAGERIYFFTREGVTLVLPLGAKEPVLAENKLTVNGRVYGVAAVNGVFLLRTGSELIALREQAPVP